MMAAQDTGSPAWLSIAFAAAGFKNSEVCFEVPDFVKLWIVTEHRRPIELVYN